MSLSTRCSETSAICKEIWKYSSCQIYEKPPAISKPADHARGNAHWHSKAAKKSALCRRRLQWTFGWTTFEPRYKIRTRSRAEITMKYEPLLPPVIEARTPTLRLPIICFQHLTAHNGFSPRRGPCGLHRSKFTIQAFPL